MAGGAAWCRDREGLVSDTTKSIVVGNLVYEVSNTAGRLRRRAHESSPQAKTAPAARLPLAFTELLERETEPELLRALPAGGGIELNARPGFGKTALLRFLAGQPPISPRSTARRSGPRNSQS